MCIRDSPYPGPSVAHLAETVWPPDEGNPGVTQLDEVLTGQPAAEVVVNADGTVVVGLAVTGAVHQDHGRSSLGQLVEQGRVRVDRSNEDALNSQLLKSSQV